MFFKFNEFCEKCYPNAKIMWYVMVLFGGFCFMFGLLIGKLG